jgi:AhpD family alkylhydroperoxidase
MLSLAGTIDRRQSLNFPVPVVLRKGCVSNLMKSKHFWLTTCGVAIGVVGSYLAARAYRKARASCPPFGRRIYTDSRALIEDFGAFWRHPEVLVSLRANEQVSPQLASKVMLTVTSANGCRSCGYAHSRYAERQGLLPEEIQSLLLCEMQHATVDEATALFFAQDYAQQQGEPAQDMVQRLVDSYGLKTARDIVTLVQAVTVANRVGNTLDALLSRCLGQPAPNSSLPSELTVLATFALGIVPLIPLLAWRAAHVLPADPSFAA